MITLANTPVLETERLILRAPQADDFAPFAAFMASDRAGFVGGPLSADLAWRGFGHVIGQFELRGTLVDIWRHPSADTLADGSAEAYA